ncbi:MAG: hypothetical protein GQ582_09075 [Methyloprofundus sp.]|nr:hypothetical protein [Methyloprofundus sp.]
MMNTLSTHPSDDKQQVLKRLSPTQDTTYFPIKISRRHFCTLSSLALISVALPSCNLSDTRLQELIQQEPEFKKFFSAIFPAKDLHLENYIDYALDIIQRLPSKHATPIMHTYMQFKTQLAVKSKTANDFNKAMGEACLIAVMESEHGVECQSSLDIIYYHLSKDSQLGEAIWGRKFSISDKKCAYWSNYDQAIR